MLVSHNTPNRAHATLVHSQVSCGIAWQLYDQGPIRWLETQDGAVQAAIDRSNPDIPVMSYIQAMLSGLALAPNPRRMLDLGYGGGTLARSLRIACPDSRVLSVEQNHAVVDIAHRWLGGDVPKSVLMTRAERLIAQPQHPVDVVFSDLHAGGAETGEVHGDAFHAAVADRLGNDGVYILNLLPRDNRDAVSLLQPLRRHFPHCWLSTVPGCQNLVVFARTQPISTLNLSAPHAEIWQPHGSVQAREAAVQPVSS